MRKMNWNIFYLTIGVGLVVIEYYAIEIDHKDPLLVTLALGFGCLVFYLLVYRLFMKSMLSGLFKPVDEWEKKLYR